MATLQELEQKFLNAHRAGDARAAKALADEVKRLRALELKPAEQPAQTQPYQPTPEAQELSRLTQNPRTTVDPAYEQQKYAELPAWQKPLVAGADIVSLAGGAPLMGFGEKAIAAARAPFTDLTYEQELANQRQLTEKARARSGWAGTGAEIASQAASLPMLVAGKGAPLLAKVAAPVVEGAAYGVTSALGNDQDVTSGGVIGAVGGSAGAAVGKLLSMTGTGLNKAWALYRAAPSVKARQLVYDMGRKAGLTPESIDDAIDRFGSQTMAMDVDDIRKPAQGAVRAATNIEPQAREVAETALSGRKLGQNQRVAQDVQRASGVEPNSRQTVQDIIDARYAQRRGPIDTAYNEARAAGYDLPREPFRDILNTPMGRKAYDDAAASLLNRRGFQGDDAASELARLDQMKQELDSIASMAIRSGDNNRAAQATGLAKLLRERIDEAMSGGEYAKARALRQAAFKEQEAIQLGADVAAKPDLGAPAAVTDITSQPPIKAPAAEAGQLFSQADPVPVTGLREGYAQQTAEELLQRTPTANALNRMSTPLAAETRAAVLGDNDWIVERGLARERRFNEADRAVSGNSSTVRQLMEAGALPAVGFGLDMATGLTGLGTVSGALGFAKKVAPLVQRHMQKPTETATELAKIFTGPPSGIPMERPIPPGALELSADNIRRALTRIGVFGAPQFNSEPAPVE